MPVVFIGHGSPMLAIEPNRFTPKWQELAQKLPKPKAIVVISAHWISEGVQETAAQQPELIYDFYGFPPELYQQTYTAIGATALAAQLEWMIAQPDIHLNEQRGLDHGAWIVLQKMYPEADIPVLQIGMSDRLSVAEHLAFARQLALLREQGVLIIGSGNLIHNLSLLDREHMDVNFAFPWAKKAQSILLERIRANDLEALANWRALGQEVTLAINSAEHYLPLLYVLVMREPEDELEIFNEEFVGGSLDMTCVKVG